MMKNGIHVVIATAIVAMSCSDDGVYTPVMIDDPPAEIACDNKAGCPDAGEIDAAMDADVPSVDAGK